MSSFVKGILVGVLLVFVMGGLVLAGLALASLQGDGIRQDTVLVLRLQGSIPEHVGTQLPAFLMGPGMPSPTSMYEITQALRRAADDPAVRALVLDFGISSTGWAKAQELRWAIQAFRESEKPVWAYLRSGEREDYYIASLADRIVMRPESFLGLSGLRMEVMFLKGTLDKLGIEVDLIRTGKYKTAAEPLTREDLSPEWREVLDASLDAFYSQLLEGVAEGRGEDATHWRAVVDEGPYDADGALRLGLVDEVAGERAFFEALAEDLEVEDPPRMYVRDYAGISRGRAGGELIAMLHASGTIVSGASWSDPFPGGEQSLGDETLVHQLKQLEEDQRVAGVILRIDSPGGDAVASEHMLRAVRRLAKQKPLVVSMSTMAASGGYYIAAAPDVPIVAYPGTYTGSIGVFTMHLNLRGLYDKVGIRKEMLSRGRFPGLFTDYRALSPVERAKVQGFVDSFYETFLGRVAEGRGTEVDAIRGLAEGRVWIGSQAAENGLVDALGGFEKAIDLVKEAAEIDPDTQVRVQSYPPRKGLLEALMSQGRSAAIRSLLESQVPGPAQEAWSSVAAWLARLRNGPQFMAPYTLTVD